MPKFSLKIADEARVGDRTERAFVKQKLLVQPENKNKLKKSNFLKNLRVYYMHLGSHIKC